MQSIIIKKSAWTKLESLPKYQQYNTLFDNKSKLLVAIPPAIQVNPKKVDIIFIYLFSKNTWRQYKIQQTTSTKLRIVYPAAINRNKIYLISDLEELVILELIKDTNQCTIQFIKNTKLCLLNTNSYSSTIIQNQLYYKINNHFIKHNINTNKHQILPNSTIQHFGYNSLIHIQNKLILFGYINYQNPSIQQYDIRENFWEEKMAVNLPNEMKFISITSILNEQMILIIATDDYDKCCLFTYDIQTHIIKKITINLPEYPTEMFAIHDKTKDALVTKTWIKNNFKELPLCLEAMINKYYINEMIHLFNINGQHYQLNLFHILHKNYISIVQSVR